MSDEHSRPIRVAGSIARGDIVHMMKPDQRLQQILWRERGHREFRRAAMRMFSEIGLPQAALAVATLVPDQWLTDEEIADREAGL